MQKFKKLMVLSLLGMAFLQLPACFKKSDKKDMDLSKLPAVEGVKFEAQAAPAPGQEDAASGEKDGVETLSSDNREISAKLMESAAAWEGFKKDASGVFYKIFQEGEGTLPVYTDKMTFHYRTYLPDGSKIQDTVGKEPLTARFVYLIKGWQAILKNMAPGAVVRMVVPSELAYAEIGANDIPPNSALIFDIHLLKVEAP